MTATLTAHEDAMMGAVEAIGVFKQLDSIGRKDTPGPIIYPAGFIYFLFERLVTESPRPVYDRFFDVIVKVKNLRSEKDAADDAYSIMDSIKAAVVGKDFGLTGVGPFVCMGAQLGEYEGGVITYVMGFRAKAYMPVPSRS